MEFKGREPGMLGVLKSVGLFHTSKSCPASYSKFSVATQVLKEVKILLITNYLNLELNPVSLFSIYAASILLCLYVKYKLLVCALQYSLIFPFQECNYYAN